MKLDNLKSRYTETEIKMGTLDKIAQDNKVCIKHNEKLILENRDEIIQKSSENFR
jgi:hypothetical protein